MQVISFFLPNIHLDEVPIDIEKYWDWQTKTDNLSNLWGHFHWVLQTYIYLNNHTGGRCRLTNDFPNEGIVITHIDLIPEDTIPNKNRFIIALLVDRGFSYKFADLYISHTDIKSRFTSESFYHKVYHIPPWPQINIIKRNRNRGKKFENIGFIGNINQLAKELQTDTFVNELKALNLNWIISDRKDWNNFENLDAIVAIRSFDKNDYKFKPALKLINAWLAEVPCILGYEYSYRKIGSLNENYLEATTFEETISMIKALKNDEELRCRLVQNGIREVENYNHVANTKNWMNLLNNEVFTKADRKNSFRVFIFYIFNAALSKIASLKKRLNIA